MAVLLIGEITYMALTLNGCTSGAKVFLIEDAPIPEEGHSPTPEAVSHGNEIRGYVELVDDLKAAGTEVEPADQIERPFLEVTGQIIKVNGVDDQVDVTTIDLLSDVMEHQSHPTNE